MTLSTLATFDDLRRCFSVLSDGISEEEFLKFARLQEEFRLQWFSAVQETQRLQRELDTSLQNMADLESKLFHARRLLEVENKLRKDAEHERDEMEKKIIAVADILQHERDIRNETKDKLAFLSTIPRKSRKSTRANESKYGANDINSTGSFLSDLSITQSEEDFLDVKNNSKKWKVHRPSMTRNTASFVGAKRTRKSVDPPPVPRRSTRFHENKAHEITDKICATTTVSFPKDGLGPIRAESTIQTIPQNENTVPGETFETTYYDIASPQKKTRKPSTDTVIHRTPTAPPLSEITNLKVPPTIIGPNIKRQHNFVSKTFLMSDVCIECQKKIRFGTVSLKCKDCQVCCHQDCRGNLNVACVPQSSTPNNKNGVMGMISDYVPNVAPMIPALIVHCVTEIENRGLNEVGIYRVSGSEREVKALKERFMRNKGTPALVNADVHVLCGCVKDFLRSLKEPLVPVSSWEKFCNACQSCNSEEEVRSQLFRAIENLPQANRDTLSFLILHFQRISQCPDVKMPMENLSRIFGPTIVGYSSPDPDQHTIFTETIIQFNVMKNLMTIPTEYWNQFVAVEVLPPEPPRSISKSSGKHYLLKTPAKDHQTSVYSLYATPLKGTIKKRKFYGTPPYSAAKKK
ncbi:RACGAP1 family protein [Megaselia abdita]